MIPSGLVELMLVPHLDTKAKKLSALEPTVTRMRSPIFPVPHLFRPQRLRKEANEAPRQAPRPMMQALMMPVLSAQRTSRRCARVVKLGHPAMDCFQSPPSLKAEAKKAIALRFRGCSSTHRHISRP